MTQVSTTNYTASGFTWATSGNDQFRITDLQNLGLGVENHDHTSSYGLPVGRIAGGCTVGTTIVNGAATLTFPTSTDTLVGRATTDTLTNKTLTIPVIKAASGSPYVRVWNAAGVPATLTGQQTTVAFDTARWSSDANWSIGLPTRLVATTSGWYSMTGLFTWAANGTGDRQIEIKYNGSVYIASQTSPANAIGTCSSVSTQYYLNAADYIEMIIYQSSGGNLGQFATTAAVNCEFMMARMTG